MGVSYVNYLINPKHRKFPFKGIIGWALLNKIPTVEELQEKYAFKYYSTMNKAVGDVNSGSIGVNEDATKDTAVAGVYTDENGGANVVLLKDHTESTRIQPSVDMTINLGGHTLSANNLVCINVLGGNLTIDGRLSGSAVKMNQVTNAVCIQVPSTSNAESVCVNNGNYCATAENGISMAFNANNIYSEVTFLNCHITANCIDGESKGIASNAISTITNCDIEATSSSGRSSGVHNAAGTATITNCDIRAYSNYDADTGWSVGIRSDGILIVNDCYARGTHSGLSNRGSLYLRGGTYESYGHGGIYFGGVGSTSYVQNATLRECAMPDGYADTGGGCNHAGFYIGGNSTANNITVYMDNCDIYGRDKPFVLRGTDGEKNNSLYISNSTVNDAKIRIDNNTHKLYIGAGNNFTAEDTTLPEACVATDEVYQRPEL